MCLITMGIYYTLFLRQFFYFAQAKGIWQFYFFPYFQFPGEYTMLCFHVDVDFIVEI